jgi:hypothetical protein
MGIPIRMNYPNCLQSLADTGCCMCRSQCLCGIEVKIYSAAQTLESWVQIEFLAWSYMTFISFQK